MTRISVGQVVEVRDRRLTVVRDVGGGDFILSNGEACNKRYMIPVIGDTEEAETAAEEAETAAEESAEVTQDFTRFTDDELRTFCLQAGLIVARDADREILISTLTTANVIVE